MSALSTDYLSSAAAYNDGRKAAANKQEGRLLIVSDDPSVRRTLHAALYSLGFDIGEARTREETVALCHIVRYDAVLLDIGRPGELDIDACRELRRLLPRAALFILSANGDHDRKIDAFEAGADDYVIKPFHLPELTARIRSALRCLRATAAAQIDEVISIGEMELHPARRLVLKAGDPVHLTPKEFDLLHHLMSHPGLPIARSRLLHVVWGPEYAEQLEYLRSFVRQLRKKIEDDPANPVYVLTDSHIGYRFIDPVQAVQLVKAI
jgi:two-component system, OmpR family, KDP operon response regulator KdpE